MDGENNGKPYEQMGCFGGFSHIFGSTPILDPAPRMQSSPPGNLRPGISN